MICLPLTGEFHNAAVENARFLRCIVIRYLVICWAFCLWANLLSTAVGQTDAEQALRSFRKNVWYDKDKKQFIPPKVQAAEDDPLRQNGRTAPPPPVTPVNAQNNRWWDNLFKSLPDFRWLAQIFPTIIFWLLGAVLLIVVGVLTYYALRNTMPNRFQRKQAMTGLTIDPTRMVDLPFEVDETVDGHPLAQAERLMQAGNYDAAIVFLFGYLLLALDQSRKIHLQKGKTNRMYLRELRADASLQTILQQAMLVFEASYFGKHSVSRTDFIAVWQRLDEFHQLLQQTAVSSAASLLLAEAQT